MMVDFSVAAQAEAESITQSYAAIDISLGVRFNADVVYAVELLMSNPDAGQRAVRGYRRLLLRNFPYSLIYRHDVSGTMLLVVAIVHQRRRPGFWQNSVQEDPAEYRLAA
jgi:toxin ParE1/3/4